MICKCKQNVSLINQSISKNIKILSKWVCLIRVTLTDPEHCRYITSRLKYVMCWLILVWLISFTAYLTLCNFCGRIIGETALCVVRYIKWNPGQDIFFDRNVNYLFVVDMLLWLYWISINSYIVLSGFFIKLGSSPIFGERRSK